MLNFTFNLPDMPVNINCQTGEDALMMARFFEAKGKEKAVQDALKELYTIDELAVRLKCSRETAVKAIKTNKIKFTTVGDSKGYRVTEKAVREFLGDILPE